MNTIGLGKLLRERRTEKGMSLREFSEYLSISHAYLNKLEKGNDPRTGRSIAPTIEALSKIASGLEIPLESLLYESGYIEQEQPLDASPNSTLELDTLAAEFVTAVTDAATITKGGVPLKGGKEYLLQAAVDTLLNLTKPR